MIKHTDLINTLIACVGGLGLIAGLLRYVDDWREKRKERPIEFSVIGAVIVGFVGVLAPMLNRDLRQNRMTVLELFIGYAVAVLTVIVLVFVLLRGWYLFAIEFGYPIFPTWPRRTTFDWLLDAVATTVSVAVYACLYVHEFYARTNDCKYLSSEARHKKWTTVAWAYGAVALISFLYQLFKYYPNPW